MTRSPIMIRLRQSVIGALVLLLAAASGAAAQQGWAPVVVRGPDREPVQPPTPSNGATGFDRPPRVAKATSIESPAMPQRPPFLETRTAEKAPSHDTAGGGSKTTQPAAKREPPSPTEPANKPPEELGPGASAAQLYCANIADAAADARFAWQKKTLTEVQKEVEKSIARLEAKIAEYQKWLARRDEFSKKAQESLVNIYSRMRPDAAASQLVKLDEETAAALLLKLDPRIASTILNEIPPAQAARLASTISGAARTAKEKKS
ncbi:MAG TPA: MotE family protein [Hyphomicrobiaceae bacterium]|nr:MotE family protein [Hyphomicrobiaceae bacterium]